MPNEVEKVIAKRFDDLSNDDHLLPEEIDNKDVRITALLSCLGTISNKRILDVGCGKGRYSIILAEKAAEVIGVDVSEELIKIAKGKLNRDMRLSFQKASITNLPFSDETFDIVITVEVIEHVPNTKKAIQEMVRVLQSGGKIVIIDKNILALHHRWLFPMYFLKRIKEMMNKWMYPRDFPFREKWFYPNSIENLLKYYCKETKVKYIHEYWRRRFPFRHLPFLNLFVIWEGVK